MALKYCWGVKGTHFLDGLSSLATQSRQKLQRQRRTVWKATIGGWWKQRWRPHSIPLRRNPANPEDMTWDDLDFVQLTTTTTMRPALTRSTITLTRGLASASHAYAKPGPPRPGPPPTAAAGPSRPAPPAPEPNPATTTSPELSPEHRRLLEEIVRVDHAGELGANWIYRGQKWGSQIRGDRATAGQVEEMWENERHHLNVLTRVAEQHRVRPTLLYPVWQGLAWGMGAATALMGKEAAMACTEAVETVIGEHYDDQLRALKPVLEQTNHPSLPLLNKILEEFRDDELEHLDTAVEEGALKAPGHALLSAAIGAACRVGIAVASKV